jgi:porphobilinogen deaminase
MLEAYVGTTDGRRHLRRKAEGTREQARELGERLAETLLEEGASEILDETRSAAKGILGNDGR